jgi:HAD superfamily hydrolase (TIGR01509 family)
MTLLFIFDMDNVLYDYSWHERMTVLSATTGMTPSEMNNRWWMSGREQAAEAGAYLSGDEYLAAFSDALGVHVPRHAWVQARGQAMRPFEDSLAAVARAAELGQVTLLTNNGALVQEHLSTLAPELPALFGDHLLTSSSYGARKPDPQVFRNVLDRYGVDADRAFFADDLQENVDGARSVGIHAHLFTTGDRMRAAIDDFARTRRSPVGGHADA